MPSAALVESFSHAGLCCSFVCLVIDCLSPKLAAILYGPMLSIVPAAWSWELGERVVKVRQRQRERERERCPRFQFEGFWS